MKTSKRILALLMCVLMCVSLLPVSAFAEEDGSDFAEAEALEEPAAAEEATADAPALAEEEPAAEPAAEGTTLQGVTESHAVSGGDAADNDALFAEYVDHVFGLTDDSADLQSADFAGDQLDLKSQTVYYILKDDIARVASGEVTSTRFSIPVDAVLDKRTFTAQELGVESFETEDIDDLVNKALGYDMTKVISALQSDCSYELYWYDKTAGYYTDGIAFSISETGTELTIKDDKVIISFTVSTDYAPQPYDQTAYMTDPAKTSAATKAVAKAKAVVSAAEGKTDLEKLRYYSDQICAMTDYNHEAADTKDFPYGNPWQLIWAFDDDPETKIVCEGYSKAFQYLCENTKFSTSIRTATVIGDVSFEKDKGGAHMWNVVQMDDGKTYLVDVTNCDHEPDEPNDGLFLRPAVSGSVWDTYTVIDTYDNSRVCYSYYNFTITTYTEAFLTLATEEYGGPKHWHSFAETVTEPTCTTQGYTTYTCECGETYTGDETLPIAHTFDENGICTVCGGTRVDIDATTFPDANFRAAVIEALGLRAETTAATQEQFNAVTELDVSGRQIKDLTGIAYFTALTTLNCSDNKLTDLDLSTNTALTSLECGFNKLLGADVPVDCSVTGNSQRPDSQLNATDMGDGTYIVSAVQYWGSAIEFATANTVGSLGDNLVIVSAETDVDGQPYVVFINGGLKGEIYLNVLPFTFEVQQQNLLMKPGEEETVTVYYTGPETPDSPDTLEYGIFYDTDTRSYPAAEDAPEGTRVIEKFRPATGTVTALNPGTAIVRISVFARWVDANGETMEKTFGYTEFRADVAADVETAVTGVTLMDTKATYNVKSTDHPSIEIVPDMAQLLEEDDSGAESTGAQAQTAGILTHAEFAEGTLKDKFDLVIGNSRTLVIVPKDETTMALKAGTYKSAITVTIDGKDFTTTQKFALTVTNKIPTVKASALKLNSYVYGENVPLTFTGAEVAKIISVESKPDWLLVDQAGMTVSLSESAPTKASGKLVLKCTLKGYTEPVNVTVSVSTASTAPSLKKSANSVTLSNMMSQSFLYLKITPSVFADSTAFPITIEKITEKYKGVTTTYTPGELGFSIEVGECSTKYNTEAYSQGYDHVLRIAYSPIDTGDIVTHSFTLYLSIAGKEFTVPITVKPVKTIKATVKATGALDTTVPNSQIQLTATIKNMYGAYSSGDMTGWSLEILGITGKKGKDELEGADYFNWDSSTGCITLRDDVTPPAGYTWTVIGTVNYGPALAGPDSETGAAYDFTGYTNFSLKMTVKSPAKATQVQVSYKTSGKMDLYGTTGITFTPVIKNATIGYTYAPLTDDNAVSENVKIYRVYNGATKKTVTDEDATAWFSAETSATGDIVFKLNDTGLKEVNAKDKFTFQCELLNAEGTGKLSDILKDNYKLTPVTFTITASTVKVSAPKTVTLLKKDIYSEATFTMAITTGQTMRATYKDEDGNEIKGYALDTSSARYYTLDRNPDGTYTIMARADAPNSKYPTSVKIQLWCVGNNTTTASATVSLTVKRV